MAVEKLSIKEAADRLGVTTVQVGNLMKNGMPHEGDGRHRLILWPEARMWRDKQILERGKAYMAKDGRSIQGDSKERRAAADAELAEIELAERRGELMTLEDGERIISEAFARVRSRLLNLPNAVGMRVTGETLPMRVSQAQALVDEVMAELASGDDVPEPV